MEDVGRYSRGPAKKRLRDYMADISQAENALTVLNHKGKETDKKADKIDPSTGSISKQNGATDLAERVRLLL